MLRASILVCNPTLIAFRCGRLQRRNTPVQLLTYPAGSACGAEAHEDLFHGLVVSNNIATGIVAAAIVEKCGLAVRRTSLVDSLNRIQIGKPSMLIVDSSCQTLFSQLDFLGANRPYTIFLSVSSPLEEHEQFIDAFVRKPLTMDGLQPIVFDWMRNNVTESIRRD